MEKNFSYFDKPISEIPDDELAHWYIHLLNGESWEDEQAQQEYEEFKAEVPKRSIEFQRIIEEIDSVL